MPELFKHKRDLFEFTVWASLVSVKRLTLQNQVFICKDNEAGMRKETEDQSLAL